MRVKKYALIAACSAMCSSAVLASIQMPPGSGIYGTAHDFTITSGQHIPIDPAAPDLGLCSVCHTPHSALTNKLLWNQKLTIARFNWGEVTTTGGTNLPDSANDGVSTKCLSCHDGTVAVGHIALFKGQMNRTDTAIMRMGRGGNGVGFRGDMTGVHPIGIPYPLENVEATYNGMTTGNQTVLAEFVANPHDPNSNRVKLYKESDTGVKSSGAERGLSGIECSSCHDVHNKQVQDYFFLRGKLNGSTVSDGYICTQCHIK